MRPIRRAVTIPLVALLLTACGLTESASPTPGATATPQPTEAATATPSPTPEPTASPTPGPGDVPRFTAGSQVATNAPGLRVRSQPGTQQRVITSLGVDANLVIGLGPVFIEGIGWYLVRDADPAEPAFGEGWVAAGFEPDPFLIPASFPPTDNPYLAGFAHDASGEYGPVLLTDADVSIRWIAASLRPDGCTFAVDLRAGSGDPVPAIRTTVGGYPAPGELFSQFFASHPELRGDIFVTVTSQCSWALTFVRSPAQPSPAPTAS
ncbi:MAG TPA: hypothetical protein VK838_06715 [Candidatus Limnocylindrales bacterium]|nr:hypothetical protein [Candidatus Limnocylindrales bacterium]